MDATKCQCGAITVDGDDFSNSMTEATFQREFPNVPIRQQVYCNCNHCVNHWGIDLCGCGSGEPVGQCDGDFEHCLNNIPAQHKHEQRAAMGWRFN